MCLRLHMRLAGCMGAPSTRLLAWAAWRQLRRRTPCLQSPSIAIPTAFESAGVQRCEHGAHHGAQSAIRRCQVQSGASRRKQGERRGRQGSGPFVAAARQQQRWRVWPRIRLIAVGWRLEVRGRLLRRHAGTRLRLRASPAHRPAHLRRTCARARIPIATWLLTWTISAGPTKPPRH